MQEWAYISEKRVALASLVAVLPAPRIWLFGNVDIVWQLQEWIGFLVPGVPPHVVRR